MIGLVARADGTEPGVLLWMLDSPVYINDNATGEQVLLQNYRNSSGQDINVVRVSATDADGAVVYLDMYADSGAGYVLVEGMSFALVNDEHMAGPIWASFNGCDTSTCSFAIELGHIGVDGDSVTWDVLAVSESKTYTELARYTSTDPTYAPSFTAWSPSSYDAVPEPSVPLLWLVGTAVLALRRRKGVRS